MSGPVRACRAVQLRPEGRNRRGETRLRGPEVLGPLRGLGIRPLVAVIQGLGTPSQRPLRAPERLSGPRGRLFRGLGEVCPLSKEREKKVGHSEAPKRHRFPGCPLRGFQPSGSYPQATDKLCVFCGIADYRCYIPTSFRRPNKGAIAEKTCL